MTEHENNNPAAITENLSRIEDFQSIAEVFKQLSDASRLRIFFLLCHEETCVSEIAELVNMTTPAVAHHLKLLKSAGLIASRRCGKEVYYQVSDSLSAKLLHATIEQVMCIVCPDLHQ